jgi:hypothetical protein
VIARIMPVSDTPEPIAFRDRFVGRIEPRIDRAGARVQALGAWWPVEHVLAPMAGRPTVPRSNG